MPKDLNLVQKIVFICNGDCCMKAGADANTLALRASIKENSLHDEIHTVRTRCFGQCKSAPIMFIHPDNIWYEKLDLQLSTEIVTSHLMKRKYLHKNILFAKGDSSLNQPVIKMSARNIFKKMFWRFNLITFFILAGMLAVAQTASVSGVVIDNVEQKSLPGVVINVAALNRGVSTDDQGNYELKDIPEGDYDFIFTLVGYESFTKRISCKKDEQKKMNVSLKPNTLNLSEVTISAATTKQGENKMDMIAMQLQPIKSAQDLLRTVPGLFIAQHAGGGKAEQIFVRGTDNDHGTDFSVMFDGIPVNLPTHAHGQGYADMHFMIPEIVGKASFYKGPFEARLGDFSVAGAALFNSKYNLDKNQVKVEYGMFNNQRALLMLNLLGNNNHLIKKVKDNAYIAAEYNYTDGYFDSKLNFKRINLFGKYNAHLNDKNLLSFTSSYFTSDWDASGQLPLRAIEAKEISRYGSVDNSEGGITSRMNLNLKLNSQLKDRSVFTNQLYYSKNLFQLFSNFTFYMNDTVDGDEIKQWENRDLFGYKGAYSRQDSLCETLLSSEIGVTTRTDVLMRGRDHVKKRELLSVDAYNHAVITNYSFYIDENWQFRPKWNLNAGLRNDVFDFNYTDKLNEENSGQKYANRFSPKLNIYFDVTTNATVFVKTGQGFHSNFIQATVSKDADVGNAIPKSTSIDIGSNFKVGKKILCSMSAWTTESEAEYRFISDDGSFENLGAVRKYGVDFSTKFQFTDYLWMDANINYANGSLLDAPKDENLIPLHPRWNSTGGLTVKLPMGLNGSLRYRYMGKRPATEDGSIYSESYFITDAVIRYTKPKFEIGISAENLFNTQWAEAQFYDESRLKNESEPVMDFHDTPGTPFYLKASVSYFF
jgi:outer membrane receptor protein involved in Fe transport/(2Fe-2S) ferredoxin